jgi:hypothetical protein
MRRNDEDFVCDILDELEGKPNQDKAKAIVKKFRKRLRKRQLEIEQIIAERLAGNPAESGATE